MAAVGTSCAASGQGHLKEDSRASCGVRVYNLGAWEAEVGERELWASLGYLDCVSKTGKK